MKIRGNSYFLMVIMVIMLVAIVISLRMEYRVSKLLPLVIGSSVLVLAAVGLWRDIKGTDRRGTGFSGSDTSSQEMTKKEWHRYLLAGAWVAGFYLAVYLLGLLTAIPLFIFAYMKAHDTRWFVAIAFALISTAFIYGVFEIALRVELYRGLVFSLR